MRFAFYGHSRCYSLRRTDATEQSVHYPGGEGPGKGKHVVLISGDEEYRSEETFPQLAKILSTEHGFDCTVLFAIDPTTGVVNPNNRQNIPGLAGTQRRRLNDHLHAAARFAG